MHKAPTAVLRPLQHPEMTALLKACALTASQEKAAYKEAFAGLRELKQEIEHLQMLLEQSRTKLQRDFEHWMNLMLRQQQHGASAVTAGVLTEGPIPSATSPARCAADARADPVHWCWC